MKKKKTISKSGIILAWGELFLKSDGVKEQFKKRLINNIYFFLKKENIDSKVVILHERLFISTSSQKKAIHILKRVFGLAWLAESFFLEDFSLKQVKDFIAKNYNDWISPKQTFAIYLKRSSKKYGNRKKLIDTIASVIERKVNLNNPKKKIFIEAREKGWFIYFKKEKALGGLPVGGQGKVLTLVSGGIDSPVSSWLMSKRGAESTWIHFHSFPLVSLASVNKVKELAKISTLYQSKIKVYFIPFASIQKAIKVGVPGKYRVLLYRRFMLKIAEKLAKKQGYGALITGESLGQVSSQTLENLNLTQEAVKMPILRPLIGMNKQEIIDIAEKIKTFQISIKPQEDCCTLFISKHQTASGKLGVIKKLEKDLKLNRFISPILKKAEIEIFS